MIFQLSTNQLNNPAPSKWLTPTPSKSYKMFFQNVTHCLTIWAIIAMGLCLDSLALLLRAISRVSLRTLLMGVGVRGFRRTLIITPNAVNVTKTDFVATTTTATTA